MILDSMKNCAAYYALSPRIEKAFKLFAEVDWEKAENGKMELDGKEIFANGRCGKLFRHRPCVDTSGDIRTVASDAVVGHQCTAVAGKYLR